MTKEKKIVTAEDIWTTQGINSYEYITKSKINEYIHIILHHSYEKQPEHLKESSLTKILDILESIADKSFSTHIDENDSLSAKQRMVNFYRRSDIPEAKREDAKNYANSIVELDNAINYTENSKFLKDLRDMLTIECDELNLQFENSEQEENYLKKIASDVLHGSITHNKTILENMQNRSTSRSETESTIRNSDSDGGNSTSSSNDDTLNPPSKAPSNPNISFNPITKTSDNQR